MLHSEAHDEEQIVNEACGMPMLFSDCKDQSKQGSKASYNSN
jgi:hypothetical protein